MSFFHNRPSSSSYASPSAASSSDVVSAIERPADLDRQIVQPTAPILKFVWIKKKNGGNNSYECKLCRHRFTGQPSSVGAHFDANFCKQRILQCGAPIPVELRSQLDAAMATSKAKKDQDGSNKRGFSAMSQPGIATSLNKQNRPAADMAIMQFIVGLGLSASIVEEPYFRVMVTALRDAGPNYLPPKRHAFGLDSYSCSEEGVQANPLHLGKVLFSELQRVRNLRSVLYNGLDQIGGTLCNDGAKWRKRSLINSTLMSAQGVYFAQSTDATGKFKDSQYLLDDVKSAIAYVEAKNVFIVCLDGACKKVLKMIWECEPIHQIFPQRFTTHGCNLLVAKIGKLFKWEIALCVCHAIIVYLYSIRI